MVRRWRTLLACVCLLPLTAFALTSAATAAAKARCTKVASPPGDGSAAQRLVNTLAPGETGCLRAGTYQQDELTLATPGIRLTSFPGERARVVGRIRVSGEGVLVDNLTLDGRNPRELPSPTINADDVSFHGNDVSSPGSGGGCLILGTVTEVQHPVIKGNRIHDCGEPGDLAGHGIYMQNVEDAEVVRNLIYDNADRGIKVGPDSDGALIRRNVIDGNPIGLNFSGEEDSASSGNLVEHNVIANSTRWWNVQSYWPGPVGGRNLVRLNCLHGGNPDPDYNKDGGIGDEEGFTAKENLVAAPTFFNRKKNDFRLRQSSECRGVYPAGHRLGASASGGDGGSGGDGLPTRILEGITPSSPGLILLMAAFLLIALGSWRWRSWAGRGQ